MALTRKLDLLRTKITQLKTAILHCPEDHFFNERAVIAHTLEIDEEGILWLAVDKPVECADNGTDSFDIVLNYHKPGLAFDLDILGDAKLINGENAPEDLSPDKKSVLKNGRLLLHVHIIDIDYWEHTTPIFKLITSKIRYLFSHHSKNADAQAYPDHQMSA